VVGVHDIITPFKFGDDRFRGFWLAEGQSLPFPIDFEGRPYNTHTTVCCAIQFGSVLSPTLRATPVNCSKVSVHFGRSVLYNIRTLTEMEWALA